MYANKGINAYRKDSLKADLASADPHRVIQLLMQGALERMALSKGYIDRKEMELKSQTLKPLLVVNGRSKNSFSFFLTFFSAFGKKIRHVRQQTVLYSFLFTKTHNNFSFTTARPWTGNLVTGRVIKITLGGK